MHSTWASNYYENWSPVFHTVLLVWCRELLCRHVSVPSIQKHRSSIRHMVFLTELLAAPLTTVACKPLVLLSLGSGLSGSFPIRPRALGFISRLLPVVPTFPWFRCCPRGSDFLSPWDPISQNSGPVLASGLHFGYPRGRVWFTGSGESCSWRQKPG